ncbi:MAG: pilus assembly PilX N-terminal domain-containing protein [Phycisphaerae bacterium]|nr:pilus assembly PilX N-terminal domain-containing protein [Phycisphaerae bacterium]
MRIRGVPGTVTHRGSALLLTLIFVAMFACMAVALAVASSTNMAISRNRVEIGQSTNLVESGLLLAQREMGGLQVTGATAEEVHACIADHFRTVLADAGMVSAQEITASADGVFFPQMIVPGPDERDGTIELTVVADGGVSANPTITVSSAGRFADAVRSAYYDFHVQSGCRLLSDYGVASRSPVKMSGNARIDGANNDAEGSLYSSSGSATRAIDMGGRSSISGTAAVSADGAQIYTRGSAEIGGERITDAPDHEWPDIDTQQFEQYVENTLTGDSHRNDTLVNIRIPPNTNPTFNGNTDLYGIIYIESPNTVTFNGNASVCGIIVCEEPAVENLSANQLKFNGNLSVSGVENLPRDDSRFDGLRDQAGTFLLAPGYKATFSGNFNTLNGSIVASQFIFSGTAGGTVRGNVLNLSDSSFTLQGNAHLTIDKANAPDYPAGLTRNYSLICVSGSYRE